MQHGSDRHGPAQDDRLARETRGQVQGGHSPRVEEWREPESAGDDQPDPSSGLVPEDGGSPAGMDAADVRQRSRLAQYLSPSALPGHRDGLVATAEANGAPDDVLAELRRLPPERPYRTITAIWVALGHGTEDDRARF